MQSQIQIEAKALELQNAYVRKKQLINEKKKKKASIIKYGDFMNDEIGAHDIDESYMDNTPFKNEHHARLVQDKVERQISSQASQGFTQRSEFYSYREKEERVLA